MPLISDPTPSLGSWETKRDDDGVAHVVPEFGPKHSLTIYCWCNPVLDGDRYNEPAISHNVAQ